MLHPRALLGAMIFALASPGLLLPIGPALAAVDVMAPEVVIERRSTARRTQTGRYRSKGPQAHRARKPNRNTIGKRVRRKHRRAA